MRIEYTGTGADIKDAQEEAKRWLIANGAPEDALFHFETLQFPKSKFFGIKKEPAKVLVWYEKPDPKPAPAPKAQTPAAPQQKKADTPQAKKAEAPQPKKADAPQAKKAEAPQPKKADAPQAKKTEAPQQKKADAPQAKKAEAPQPKKTDAPQAKREKPAQKKEAAPAPEAQPEEKRIPVELPENDAAARYLRSIVAGMGIAECEITLEQIEGTEEYVYNLECGSANGSLIGNKGETLDAIQYLVRLSVNKGVDENKHRKISVNAGNYRAKRNGNLRALAARQARQVLKFGRNVALEPMSPYERRIIHTTIQEIEGVTSHSVGSDANRRVIISLEEGVQPTHPGRGGDRGGRGGDRGRGGRGGDRGGRGGRGGYQKREPYKPAVTREPRSDSKGSLYEKIVPPAAPQTETDPE